MEGDDDDVIMVGDVESESDVEAESHDEYDDDADDNDDDDEEESEDDGEIDIEDEIVEQFTRTFHNGDYDQEFDTGLSIDEVYLPARPTQTLYNKPDNWRERNQIGLEKIKRQLQSCIEWVSHDTSFNLELIHNGPGIQLVDNEGPIVWHEPIFDEYWNQLETEIDLRKIDLRKQKEIISDIRDIHIENVEIKKVKKSNLSCYNGRIRL
jgi:RNA polymerase-binding transcription factor DksA